MICLLVLVASCTNLSPGGGDYEEGTEVTLSPVPNSGYAFGSWSGLNPGAEIYFVALSKNVNYFDLTTEEKFNYIDILPSLKEGESIGF